MSAADRAWLALVMALSVLSSCQGAGEFRDGAYPILQRPATVRIAGREFVFVGVPEVSVRVIGDTALVNGIPIRVDGDRVTVNGTVVEGEQGDRIVVGPDGSVRARGENEGGEGAD